jgi:8-oxo-dGTP pyrophosphatase MutT (NUDIX family)
MSECVPQVGDELSDRVDVLAAASPGLTYGPEVVPRLAATVILLRDGAAGLEAWLLTRVTQMVFAAGATVFPGGRVDADDVSVPWSGTSVEEFATRFDCSPDRARALVGAAVRETFEETGVLLTVPRRDLSEYRADVEAGIVSFVELLVDHGLRADVASLRPWAHWITPPGGPRRYDTHFFVAALPDGAQAADVTSESSVADWVAVVSALAEHNRGERLLLLPTEMTLRSLLPFATVADVLAGSAARDLSVARPRTVDRK